MTLTREEMFKRNLALTKKRLLRALENPRVLQPIVPGAHVINLPQNDPELLRANLAMAMELAKRGDGRPIVMIPEVTERERWQEFREFIVGKRIVDVIPNEGGTCLDLIFEDETHVQLRALAWTNEEGEEQSFIDWILT